MSVHSFSSPFGLAIAYLQHPPFLQCVALSHFQFLHLKYQYHLTHPSVSYTGSWHDRANLDLSQLLRDVQLPHSSLRNQLSRVYKAPTSGDGEAYEII